MKKIIKRQKGFTLIEVLIATTLFMFVIFIATNIFIDVVSFKKDLIVYNHTYRELRNTSDFISDKVQDSYLDFEEYFSINVSQAHKNPDNLNEIFYGVNHGVYESRFYEPGQASQGVWGRNPNDLGVVCQYQNGDQPNLDIFGNPDSDCSFVQEWSVDQQTFTNPFTYNENDARGGVEPAREANQLARNMKANAFCDNQNGNICETENLAKVVDELYLLDSEGKVKTIIGKKLFENNRWVIAMTELEGVDIDQNGQVDLFKCKGGYNCDEDYDRIAGLISYHIFMERSEIPWENLLGNHDMSFVTKQDWELPYNPASSSVVPISPLDLNILDLKFIISPVENPYLAKEERQHLQAPSVTMLIKAENSVGDIIEIQNTVGFLAESSPPAYPPENDTMRAPNLIHWMVESETAENFGPLPGLNPPTNRE